jgi:hypothetical protein
MGRRFLHFSGLRAKRTRPLTVDIMIEIGAPALYAKLLRQRRILRMLGYGSISALTAAVAVWALPNLQGAGLLACVAAAAVGLSHNEFISVKKAQAGIQAEEVAARSIRQAPLFCAAFGMVLDRGDCDAIAIGPQLAVIEVKHGRGTISIRKGRLFINDRAFKGDPVRQSHGQASALRRICGQTADTVVCVTGMQNAPFEVNGTWLCGAKDLPAVLTRLPHRLTQMQAATLVGKLRAENP